MITPKLVLAAAALMLAAGPVAAQGRGGTPPSPMTGPGMSGGNQSQDLQTGDLNPDNARPAQGGDHRPGHHPRRDATCRNAHLSSVQRARCPTPKKP